MRGIVVSIVIALVWPGAGPDAIFEPAEAEAQVWKPGGKERTRPAKKKRRRRKKPDRKKPDRKKDEGNERQAKDPPEEVIFEEEPPEEVVDEDFSSDDPFAEPSGGSFRGAGDSAGAGDGDTDTIILEDDDLEEVGADVTFSDSDLATGSTSGSGDDKGGTRLETLAMSFLRLGVDAVHDEVPTAPTGVKAVGEDTLSFRAHGEAQGTGRFGKRVKVKVAGLVNADLSLDSDTNVGVQRYEAEVWDTYVDLYGDWIDVRFGQQMVAWGMADLLSPNDVVNARDLRRGFLDRPEDLRVPVLALSTSVYDGPFSAQLLWVPVAPTNRFELLEGDYALLGPNAATPVERRIGAIVSTLLDDPELGPQLQPFVDIAQSPDNSLDTGELGGEIAVRTRSFDLAGYALWGHERTPRIELHPNLRQALIDTAPEDYTPEGVTMAIGGLQMMGEVPVDVSYPRRLHVGAALGGRIEPIGIKIDAAYQFDAVANFVPPGGGPLLAQPGERDQVAVTGSVDYDRGTSFTLILEGSHIRWLDVPDEFDVFQFDHDQLNLVGSRMEWTPARGPVTLRFLGFVDVGSPSYALRPAIRLSGHDNLSLEIAATLFGGPEGSFGGVADRNDEILLTAQYGL